MFQSPSHTKNLTPEFTTQLTKTYKDEDLYLRRLTDYKNCISIDDYIYVAHKNCQDRIKLYKDLFHRPVSEFQVADKDPSDREDYLILELTKPQ